MFEEKVSEYSITQIPEKIHLPKPNYLHELFFKTNHSIQVCRVDPLYNCLGMTDVITMGYDTHFYIS